MGIGFTVYAYGGSSPSVVGHSAGEVEGTISSGFCVFSDSQTSCPTGWTRDSSFDGRTIRGASSPGGTGGADSHTHAAGTLLGPSHTHSIIIPETGWPTAGGCGAGHISAGAGQA
ncbi:MAG: hypothetical protein KJ721_02445 [Nanoarchaeota archaeon]|nr:hypothetical protein [Nanoarchaeota archaeon]